MSKVPAPIPPITVRIDIGGASKQDALHILKGIFEEADTEGYIGTCFGGSCSGRYSVTVVERDIETEAYRNELLAWFDAEETA